MEFRFSIVGAKYAETHGAIMAVHFGPNDISFQSARFKINRYNYATGHYNFGNNYRKKEERIVKVCTLNLGVGLSPATDSTIQFSELPNIDELLISGAADEQWQSSSSE